MTSEKKLKRVLVLMSTYNGLSYLGEQIESVLAQNLVDVSLLVRDDDSNDGTKNLLKTYRDEGKLELIIGDNRLGPARSFITLVEMAGHADYYAFCDQDDIWCPNKLLAATETIEATACRTGPVLYGTAVMVSDSKMRPVKLWSCVPPQETGGAIFQNSMIGNTLVFNFETLNLLRLVGARRATIMHDWWSFLIVKLAGGTILFNESASVRYRIHESNVIGHKRFISSLVAAVAEIFSAIELAAVFDQFFEATEALGDLVSDEYQNYELRLINCRHSFWRRLGFLASGGLVCRTRKRQILMFFTFLIYGGRCVNQTMRSASDAR